MSRYIDADAIISFVDAGHLRNPLELAWSDNDVVDMIESRPTVDAVPVEWINGFMNWLDSKGYKICSAVIQKMMNDFRADGERKDGDE